MQSGYGGGVSEIQQFMVEGCSPSLFPISTAAAPPDLHAAASHPHKFLPHHPHPAPHHAQPPPPPTHFSHFHSIPITQQLFHPQFHLFHHPVPHHEQQQQQLREQQQQLREQQQRRLQLQQLGLDQESGPENSSSPTPMMGGGGSGGGGGGSPAFLAAAMNFKLAVNESSGGGGGSRDGLNDDEGMLQGDDGSESRVPPWQREEESSIKEPFWRPLDIDYINRNSKRCKENQPENPIKYCKKSKEGGEHDQGNSSSSNYKLFSELEAIYKPGGAAGCSGNNQTGSGSALTGENPPAAPVAPGLTGDQHVSTVNHGSETSTGEEAPSKKHQKSSGSSRRKRRRRQQLSSIAAFFEGLVKQLMDHQEGLHRKFLEVMERRDQERTSREEAWRKQESAKSSREAAARAQERALASTREAAIISFLEKITGESLNLPAKPQFPSQLSEEPQKADNNLDNSNPIEPLEAFNGNNDNADHANTSAIPLNTSRWPKAEVQALIGVRSSLESRFQEPGLKGPLWEEVSSMMASMGYSRSAKRCKEKWENINKYFRKTKDSGKKRAQHSKTCPYFHQLDQLYSKSVTNYKPPPPPATASVSQSAAATSIAAPTATTEERKDNSELLDAIVVSTDNSSINLPEMGSLRFDFNGSDDGENDVSGTIIAGKGLMELGRQHVAGSAGDNNNEDEAEEEEEEAEEMDGEEEGEGEGEGESQDNAQGYEHFPGTKRHHKHLHKGREHPNDSTLFFQRLNS